MSTFISLLIFFEWITVFPAIVWYLWHGYEHARPRLIFCIVFLLATAISIGISAFVTHVTRPGSLTGTYTIEKAVPEMDRHGATGDISCIAKDKDGKKVVLTTDGTLKSYKSIKITHTSTFLDSWNKDQYGNNWSTSNALNYWF